MQGNKNKRSLAAKLRTKEETENKVPLFRTIGWLTRRYRIQDRIRLRTQKIREKKMQRLLEAEMHGFSTEKQQSKMSPAERRQLNRKIKIAKFKRRMNAVFG